MTVEDYSRKEVNQKMHVLFVRHGQSENNVIEAQVGDCAAFYQRRVVDPALSSLGERQAEGRVRVLFWMMQPD